MIPLLFAGAIAVALIAVLAYASSPISKPYQPSPSDTPIDTPTSLASLIFVSSSGQNHSGLSSENNPFRTINFALSKAKPGTTIIIYPGEYKETLTTYIDGQNGQPITLKPKTGSVRVVGNGRDDHLFSIKHDYYIIDGLEFTGADILLWLEKASRNIIRNNHFYAAASECVRLKYHSTNNLLTNNRLNDCGLQDFTRAGNGKNGEGIYIGTAPEQLEKNPTSESDQSNNNIISYNHIITNGNECVDIKEGSQKNLVEYNDCSGQRDPESAGLDSRGSRNIFRYNQSHDNLGAGIRFGGDTDKDGLHNEAYDNKLFNNQGYAIKITRQPQGQICGNEQTSNQLGLSNIKNLLNQPCSP